MTNLTDEVNQSDESLPDKGDDSNQLPAKDLCNAWGERNPILGKGALGNEKTGKMYYQGGDRKKLVEIVQRMLKELKKYDLGTSGPGGDGVDGIYGDSTEEAIKQFQEEHKDWDGDPLKVDGLVGPETSDALNRQMVGRWYRRYQTPEELVEGNPYHTVTSEYLAHSVLIKSKKASKARVFIVGEIPKTAFEATLTIRLIDTAGRPLRKANYVLEINEPVYETKKDITDDNGVLSQKISNSAKTGKLILDKYIFNLIIENQEPANTNKGAMVRLGNLGYITDYFEKAQIPKESIKEDGEDHMGDQIKSALGQFQESNSLDTSGELDGPTSKKLEEIYGC